MDISNLRQTYPALISYLQEEGYSKGYIGEILTDIKQVLEEASDPGITTYEEYFESIHARYTSKATLHHKYKVIGKIKLFDLHGILPQCNRRSGFLKPDYYASLSPDFKSIVDNFVDSAGKRGVSEHYIYHTKSAAIKFFHHQQSFKHTLLPEINEDSALSFFYEDGQIVRGYHVLKQIKAVLKENLPFDAGCRRIITILPAFRNRHKVYPFLENEELDKIKNLLMEDDASISLRDKAILTMALYTGIRGCDIRALELDNIDWTHNLIHTVQSKTDSPLILPLRPVVGNAIWKYIECERPESDCRKVFLTTYKIKKGLTSSSISQIVRSTFNNLDIRQNGSKVGLHLFRHHFATSLLADGIPSPIITKILGHDSPASLEAYLGADLIHLKECALSIEKYPVGKGVLEV
jgi:integrase